MTLKRGALIVIEGIDRTGKSTQCKSLVDKLKNKNFRVKYMNFPARHTEIGKVINSYLTKKEDLPDEAIHLLFSANRWEQATTIIKTLNEGTSVIVDRYCYSGVAFSVAKGLNFNWCKSSDAGLPRPDKVFFFTMPLELIQIRNGFGNERYETSEFQKKIPAVYDKLKENNWEDIDASRSIEIISAELVDKCMDTIQNVQDKPIMKLWLEIDNKFSD